MNNTLILVDNSPLGNLDSVVSAWANSTTDSSSPRRGDLLRDKTRAVEVFFSWCGNSAENVRPADVLEWQAVLERRGFSANSVYGMISKLSSFFEWLLRDEIISGRLRGNPVSMVRPKAPKPYQSESVKSLDDDEIKALLAVIKTKADQGDLCAKRDLAIVFMFLVTGARRAEILGLKWGNLKFNGMTVMTARRKGGETVSQEIGAPEVKEYLFDYLKAAGRLETMKPNDPLWLRHDRGAKGQGLSSHGWALALKDYGKIAGIDYIHCHMTRHSYARLVAEESGSLNETSEALGHKSLHTTKVYVQKVGCKKDKFSVGISKRLEF